jgi:type II secretory pathway pseudopilin PulG
MNRHRYPFRNRPGYTLIELLITITLTMMMMYAVTTLFAKVSQGVANARSTLEMTEALRGAAARVRMDLEGATAVTSAPERPDAARGYLEIIEGPIGPGISVVPDASGVFAAANSDIPPPNPDTTVGDPDDVLMLTTRSRTQPFVGRCASAPGGVLQSDVAEVAYFVRGRTLYRRVLLVAPSALPTLPTAPPPPAAGFYANNDVSVRMELVNNVPSAVANTLADLTRRECRFAHPIDATYTFQPGNVTIPFPCDARRWFQLGLPTLQESSHPNWIAGGMVPVTTAPSGPSEVRVPSFPWRIDYWKNPHPWDETDSETGRLLQFPPPPPPAQLRGSEDVLLNNVVSFDVKVWDPLAPIIADANGRILIPGDPGYATNFASATLAARGAYVDLDYREVVGPPVSAFSDHGDLRSGLASNGTGWVYDTWSTSYAGSRGTNGLDDPDMVTGLPDGVVDDPGEWELPPPYAAKLRGIQIKIRVFEPGSRQVRELTLVQEFVAK